MSIKTAATPEGVLLRDSGKAGAPYFLMGIDGFWATATHGKAYARLPRGEVPQKIKDAYLRFCEQHDHG